MNQSNGFRLYLSGQPTPAAHTRRPSCAKGAKSWIGRSRYRLIMARVMDDQLTAGITKLIEEAEAEKASPCERHASLGDLYADARRFCSFEGAPAA